MPSSQFHHIAQEKQRQILLESLREFAEKGYDLASTNRIVEQAGISKGVLFKYFNDKASLFTYVCQVAFEEVAEQIPPVACEDLFVFLKTAALQKIRFSQEHPLTYRLLLRIAKEPNHPVYASVMSIAATASQEYMRRLSSLLPKDRLRDGVTWEHVLSLVTWVSNGLLDSYIARLPDTLDDDGHEAFAPILQDLDVYYRIIQEGTYREGGAH